MKLIGTLSSYRSAWPDPTWSAESTKSPLGVSISPRLQAASERRAELDRILNDYQVKGDEMVAWTPNMGGVSIDMPFVQPKWITRTEAELLEDLASTRGLVGLKGFRDIMSNDQRDPGKAYGTADRYYPRVGEHGQPIAGGEDGHNDAFRHAYFNALLTKNFGLDFAAAFATAHESTHGNFADREAMDLYNNDVGRRIAMENPEASDDELAGLVHAAVKNGEMVVIDGTGELAFSDEVPVGQTGSANDKPRDANRAPPAVEPIP